ncbi:MAG: hypothetical protein V7764_16120 [Pseudomonas marincola]|uniref:hypothetical protein n=1 Tax=Pseudomonas marincola TaxID=437900 RepID=UPI003002FD89
MDELIEGAAKTLLRVLGGALRLIIWLVWELCFQILAWYAGWPLCRVITLGHYPQEGIHDYDHAPDLRSFVVCTVGLVAICSLAALIGWLLPGS